MSLNVQVAHEQYHLADVGLHGQMKQFLNHQFCVGYMDLEWRGDSSGSAYALPEGYSPFQSCFDMLLPVRHLSCFQKRHKTLMPKGERVAVDLVMVASVRSHLLGNEERRRATNDSNAPTAGEFQVCAFSLARAIIRLLLRSWKPDDYAVRRTKPMMFLNNVCP